MRDFLKSDQIPLNRYCCKFGPRQNLTKTQFLHDTRTHVVFRQMADSTIEVVDVHIVNDLNLKLSTQRVCEKICLPDHINVCLASFNTC